MDPIRTLKDCPWWQRIGSTLQPSRARGRCDGSASAKTLPTNLERRVFPDTQMTAYRLAA